MESVEIANLKPGQVVTLEFGNKEAVLTKLDEPRKFNMEDWFEDEVEVYILEDVIEEDEALHYAREAGVTLSEALAQDQNVFGAERTSWDFLGRTVDGIEMEEEEEEEEEAEEEGEE
ncbi:hypothetical protein [Magnetofaba australis]|uniref:Uncharacterized protein n=1 Tax=Magnetofaba australis IT-1 TaxID=1434232 RepID=A0A1Y2K1M9_9PROT|nr:hypothetical protein [Magnetofaba australis]OSM01849.1 hypothetical protein MAIT1_01893 [Magnetofaba australis IT-1]